jgi:hypothetical protein
VQIPSNAIRESDLFVLEYRSEGSQSKWSSVVVAANVQPEVAKAVLEAQAGLKIEMKK